MRKLISILFIFCSVQLFGQEVLYNFESGNIDGWEQRPAERWAASSDLPIAGSYSLQHRRVESSASTDTVSIVLPSWNISTGNISWQLLVKHGYDPSSSNNWGFWLMSDSLMKNGYVVGVNYTGSDDLLKLWKVQNGSATVLFSSTINWQQTITKTGVGAIGVKRQSNGTFTLEVNTSGSLASLSVVGSVANTDVSSFVRMGAVYKYTSSAKNLLWIDDLSISYEPQNQNDITSSVLEPQVQVTGESISALATSEAQAVEVFRFAVCDSASTDNLPTQVRRVVISNPSSANWEQVIGGVLLKIQDEVITINSAQIGSSSIVLNINSEQATVNNGEQKEFSLWIYLKSEQITDGQTLSFAIAQTHAFVAEITGSGFASQLASPVLSNEFTVDVEATKLCFIEQPLGVSANMPFTVKVGACNVNGSIDADYSGNVQLSVDLGTGTLISESSLTASVSQGVATWTDLKYSTTGQFRIKATSAGLQDAQSQIITVAMDSTTTIEVPAEQPQSVNIQSICTMPERAFELMRLKFIDTGGDDEPTNIKSIKLLRPSTSNTAINKIVAGVLISCNGYIVPTSEVKIAAGNIEVFFTSGSLLVPNGQSLTVLVRVYFKSGGLIDNDLLQLVVPQNHEFTVHDGGSMLMPTLDTILYSSNIYIDVDATTLTFSHLPKRVGLNSHFSVTVGATDLYANVDTDYAGSIELSKNLGDGNLQFSGQNTLATNSGTATFDGLSYSPTGVFNLLARNAQMPDVVSSNITCGDSDASVISIVNEVDTLTIHSTCTDAQSAAEVLRFCVADGGSTDNLPTIPTRITLNTFNPENTAQLAKSIGGFVIELPNGTAINTTFSVSSGKIIVEIPEFEIVVPNADSLELKLKLYLNASNIIDCTQFRFYISASGHGLVTSTDGTDFCDVFPTSIFGKPCRIEVDATRMLFAQYPFFVEADEQFTVLAMATDDGGNLDVNYSGIAQIQKHSGSGVFTANSTSVQLENGVAQWSGVNLSLVDEYKLGVWATNLSADTSHTIIVGYNSQILVDENFENQLPPWNGLNNWALSGVNPIAGEQSLVHAGSENSTQNFIAFDFNLDELGMAVEWEATLRNGNWDPTSTSYFYMVLAATSEDYTSDNCSGIAMGINPSASNDFITLWQFVGTKRTPLVVSNYDWDENQAIKIRATLEPSGIISLWYQNMNSQQEFFAGSANIGSISNSGFSGFIYGYPAARVGQFWIDNVAIRSIKYIPQIETANALSLNNVQLIFSKCVNSAQAQNTSSYSIIADNGSSIQIENAAQGGNCRTILLETERLPREPLTLFVQNISDGNGGYIVDSIRFGFEQGCFGQLVINEIMANPSSTLGLPEFEYIELYNPTADTVDISNWRLLLKNTLLQLPSEKIAPADFAVLCTATGATELAEFGRCVPVSGFSQLTNDGMLVKLFNSNGNLVSFVNYSKTWYGDASTENGGYSLERIDATNPAEGASNWTASTATIGGTPGTQNSVIASNPDQNLPTSTLQIVDSLNLLLHFSEPMDSLELAYILNYPIDNEVNTPVSAKITSAVYDEVLLTLQSPIEVGELYTITFTDELVDFAGNALQNSTLEFLLPHTAIAGDVVVNEVLFNPNSGGVDFVEVYNRSDKVFDLSQMYLANRASDGELSSINAASGELFMLQPRSYAVITTNPSLVEQFYFVQNTDAFAIAPKIASFSNDKGYVVLLNANMQIVDELAYSEKMHNKLITNAQGVSLERVNFDKPTNLSTNWQSAAQSAGYATPTYKNSQFSDSQAFDESFSISPETFSPDADGRDDYLLISYKLPEPGYIANIRVFNASGIEVCRLANNAILGTEGEFRWDGQNSNNQLVAMGIYVVHVEYNNLNGSVSSEKFVCVVAKK